MFVTFVFSPFCDLILICKRYGPPGTGKTLIARAVASNIDAKFLKVVSSAIVDKLSRRIGRFVVLLIFFKKKRYIGESARVIREMFGFAREHEPCIIFMDGKRKFIFFFFFLLTCFCSRD